ncbi:MAG: FHA domain-containing protein, partial [Pirellulaceae bacterium]|nr:FHA domain-containing protein [Pirellulaceae bacterium]
ISRCHARIRREEDCYLLEPIGETFLNGQKAKGTAFLSASDEIQLGPSVRLKFELPSTLSSSAVLTFLSKHRTRSAVKSIILLANACIFSKESTAHIRNLDWKMTSILYPNHGELAFKTEGPYTLDNSPVTNSVKIGPNSKIICEDFTLFLE